MGCSRSAFKNQVLHKENLGPDPDVPGPGTYIPLAPIGTNAKKFALKGRLEYGDPEIMAKKKNTPFPGVHGNPLAINELGNYCSSEVNNSKAAKFSTSRRTPPNPDKYQTKPDPGAHE